MSSLSHRTNVRIPAVSPPPPLSRNKGINQSSSSNNLLQQQQPTSISRESKNKLWDRIIIVLIVCLVVVVFGFVFFFGKDTYYSQDAKLDKSFQKMRIDMMNRIQNNHHSNNKDSNDNHDDHHHNNNNKEDEQGDHPQHDHEHDHQNNENHKSDNNHHDDNNNNNNNHLAKPQHPHDDENGELLLDAGKFTVITKPSDSDHDSFWKFSCVGQSEVIDNRKMSLNKGHQQKPLSSCIYNAEFFDRRDLVTSASSHDHHQNNNGKDHQEQEQLHKNHEVDENFRKLRKIGDGIRRKLRPVPDDALVEDNLFERKLFVKESSKLDANDDQLIIEAPSSSSKSTFFIKKSSPSFVWQLKPTSPSSSSKKPLEIEMTSNLNHRDNVHHLIRSQEHTSTFVFNNAENVKFFGLGNRGDSMELPADGKPITVKNLDINHYQLNSHITLYGSVPLIYAAVELSSNKGGDHDDDDDVKRKHQRRHHREVVYVGIFYLNGATMKVSVPKQDTKINFMSEGGGVRVFFLPGPTPTSILQQYYKLTGVPFFPPLYSLGYHQSRWTYKNQQDVISIHRKFLENKLPMDVVWLDIDHTDDKKYFTWDTNKFPEPEAMQYTLFDEAGRRLVTISDPHIKHQSRYHVFDQGLSGNHFVTHSDGRPFYGHCWPGQSAWIDFLKEETRTWYSTLYQYGAYHGSTLYTSIWNDMNEPSVFSGPDLTFPMDEVHHFNGEVRHRDVHNVYGFYQSMATFKGLYDRDLHLSDPIPPRRPFALTRSFFAGSHRYAAVWTGDNQGKWSHLQKAIDMSLMLSMSGIPLVGADIGGFFDSTQHHLLATWYAAAVTNPFFRGHSHQDTERREPYLIRDQGGRITRALQLRYRVIPYLYTCFSRLHFFSEPVMQPLFFDTSLGIHAPFVFGGGDDEESENDLHFNANSAEYFYWGHALLWRPFVQESELHDLHSNPSVDLCSSKKRNNLLWLSGGNENDEATSAPNFVSWCSMEWVNPSSKKHKSTSCKVQPTTCETPVFQRSQTIVTTVAYPSLRYNVDSFDNEHSSSPDSFVHSIPRPRSTQDLLQPALTSKNKETAEPIGLELRVTLSIADNDIQEGDLLASGHHFIDSNGENEISAKSNLDSVKFCMLDWNMKVISDKRFSLCASPHVAEAGHDLPRSNPDVCVKEIRRLRRAVFLIHHRPASSAQQTTTAMIDKIKEAKLTTTLSGDDVNTGKDGDTRKVVRDASISKTQSNSESHIWEVPLTDYQTPENEGFQKLKTGFGEWCIILQ